MTGLAVKGNDLPILCSATEFNRLRKAGSDHLIESTGKKLRSMMSWMDKEKLVGDK